MVIMAIAGKQIAKRTKRNAIFIETAPKADERKIIAIGMPDTNGAQSVEILIGKFQDLFVAFARIAKQFSYMERGEALT